MSTLLTLRPGLTLDPEAGASWARAESHLGRQIDVNRSLADYDTQLRLYLAYVAYRNGSGPYAVRALHPLESMHCRGLAVDSDDGYNSGVVALLSRHGWIRTASDEPWHFDYIASRDQFRGTGFPSGSGATSFQEDDMSAAAEAQILAIYQAIFPGGPSMPDGGRSIGQSLAEIHAKVSDVERDGVKVSLRQEVADAKTMVMQLLGRPVSEVVVDVDEEAIAASVVSLISSSLHGLSDEDVKRLAVAAADENDRRDRERLG